MGELSLTLSKAQNEAILKIAEETGLTRQTVLRQIIYDFFRDGGFEKQGISEKLKAELRDSILRQEVNRVRFGAMRAKRSVFLPQLVGRFMSKVRNNNRNITLEEMEVLTKSYLEEAELYGEKCVHKTRMRIAEEMESIRAMREYEEGI